MATLEVDTLNSLAPPSIHGRRLGQTPDVTAIRRS